MKAIIEAKSIQINFKTDDLYEYDQDHIKIKQFNVHDVVDMVVKDIKFQCKCAKSKKFYWKCMVSKPHMIQSFTNLKFNITY